MSGQSFDVVSNRTFPFTCPKEAVVFICESTSSAVEWVLEPLKPLNASVPTIRPYLNSAPVFGLMNISEDITVELLAVQPMIITTLTIVSSGSLSFTKANVICRALSNNTLNDRDVFDLGKST